jgi:cysteine desulfurase
LLAKDYGMKKHPNYIYFDHAATTPVLPEVARAINDCLLNYYGNASESHLPGRRANDVLEKSRKKIAEIINAQTSEIIFTGSGTESDNIAIFGIVEANKKRGDHLITTKIEHPAVMMPFKILARKGFKVTYLPVDSSGMVDPEDLRKEISSRTILVSIMHANNIFGTIQPIIEIGKILKEKDITFHTDAVQTFCSIKTDVKKLGVDLLSISGHKIYGPKGVGALYVRKKTRIMPYIYGGGQEKGIRSGTENIPGIAGLAKAAEISSTMIDEKKEKLTAMRRYLKDRLLERIEDVSFIGHPEKRLPGNCNFSFKFIEGEAVVLRLDNAGIAVSSGSACSASSTRPSHALVALGLSGADAAGSLRITLGFENTYTEIDYFLETIDKIIKDLREISPLYKKIKK